MTDDNVSHRIPLDAPGGASYIKFRPFLTRSSPINNLVMCKFVFVINDVINFLPTQLNEEIKQKYFCKCKRIKLALYETGVLAVFQCSNLLL